MAALLRDGTTRAILFSSGIDFFTPEHAIAEVRKHKDTILKKSGLDDATLGILLDAVLEKIEVTPESGTRPHLEAARKIIGHIDETDAPFIACALTTGADGIWTHDDHFTKQVAVAVFNTGAILKLLVESE